MRTIFFETTSFTATVGDYLNDDEYRQLQVEMQANPLAGDVMPRRRIQKATLARYPQRERQTRWVESDLLLAVG